MLTSSEHTDTVKIKTPAASLPADRALSYELCLHSQHMAQAQRDLREPGTNVPPPPAFCLLLHRPDGVGEP